MNKRYLFLDDVRQVMDTFHYTKHPVYTEDNWDVVRNYNEFCNYIQDNGVPALISFDHDLGGEIDNDNIDFTNIENKDLS